MNTYQKISCEDHSVYELVIVRSQSMRVDIGGKIIRIKPVDMVTKNGVEFLIFIDECNQQQKIRADLIIIQK